jgi:hypothetical protein
MKIETIYSQCRGLQMYVNQKYYQIPKTVEVTQKNWIG